MRIPQTVNPLAGIAIQTFVPKETGTDSEGRPEFSWTTRLIVPDAPDVKSFNCSLVVDSVGSFSITLDNKGQKFFRTDELESLADGTSALADFASRETTVLVQGKSVPAKDLFTRYNGDWTKGDCYFRPMMIVKMFARDRFLLSGRRGITNIFTGVISTVTDSFQGGVYEVTLAGESVLKWLQLSHVLVDPALAGLQNQSERISRGYPSQYYDQLDLFTTRYAGRLPEDIMKELILGRILKDAQGNDALDEATGLPIRVGGVATYSLETTTPTEMRDEIWGLFDRFFKEQDHQALADFFNRQRLHIHPLDLELSENRDKAVFATFLKRSLPSLSGAEFKSRLSICQDAARAIQWEFYADGNGDLWFHPPLLNIQRFLTKSHPEVYTLNDEDRISWSITRSDKSIVTRTEVTPEIDMLTFDLNLERLAFTNFYEDEARIPIYGRRTDPVKTPLVKNFEEAKQLAEILQKRKNTREEITADVAVPFRPELKLAQPFYVPKRNLMFNIHSISHSYPIGGNAQTRVGLNYGRKPWRELAEIIGFETATPEEIDQLKRLAGATEKKTGEGGE